MLAIYLLLGAVAGAIAGLLGVGGGLVLVPAFAIIFQASGMSGDSLVHLAVGTSLATIIFTSLTSIWAHHQRGAVIWPAFFAMAPGIALGALGGGLAAQFIPGLWLSRFFGLFELYVALQLTFEFRPNPYRNIPGRRALFGVGSLIGGLSAVLGIGGGTMTTPFLVWCNVEMRKAVATASAVGLPIALAGGAGFVLAGWRAPDLPAWSLGYVYLPALVGVTAASMAAAPFGAMLAHRLRPRRLRQIFALVLYLLAAKMLLG